MRARRHGVADGFAGDDSTDRKSAAKPLGNGDDVGPDARCLVGEQRAGAPNAALHLVCDHQRAELVRRGALVQEGGVVFAASAIDEAARVVARLLADQPDGITVAEARDAWGTTRKFAIPLITRLDETGVTRRRGDLRIAGPRLPQG